MAVVVFAHAAFVASNRHEHPHPLTATRLCRYISVSMRSYIDNVKPGLSPGAGRCLTASSASSFVAAEYVGLPLAFLGCGVSYVIGTLWQVNRISSANLVTRHYEYLQEGKMSVPLALNAAQRDIMRLTQDEVIAWIHTWLPEYAQSWEPEIRKRPLQPYAHPYYWAGFYLTGAD
jgi:CHAT domain-containing protein